MRAYIRKLHLGSDERCNWTELRRLIDALHSNSASRHSSQGDVALAAGVRDLCREDVGLAMYSRDPLVGCYTAWGEIAETCLDP